MDVGTAIALHREGRYQEAEAAYRRLAVTNPDDLTVYQGLGALLLQTGRAEEALPFLRRCSQADPESFEFMVNLGGALHATGRTNEALSLLEAAVAAAPTSAQARYNYAAVLEGAGRLDEALEEYAEAIRLRSDYVSAFRGKANVFRRLGRHADAISSLRKAVDLRPNYAESHNDLAATLSEIGDLPGALDCYRRLVELRPDDPGYHSALLVMMHYSDRFSPQELFAEARRWAARHAEPLTRRASVRFGKRASGERLRIGYMSGDFRDHPVGRYTEAVLSAHDRSRVCLFCYSNVTHADELTARLRARAENWRDVAALSDEQLTEQIRADRIDVLIDLAGHFANNRLLVFARRAAPVQTTHFGYCDTTGMSAMNWRITDAVSDPVGKTEQYHSERLYRMPEVAWPYRPMDETPDPGPLPALSNGYITFSCLNNLVKVSDRAVALWSKILLRLPSSRLLLLSKCGDNPHITGRFEAHGVGAARLIFVPMLPRYEYLATYRRADIALDTFPYNGDNTTCDALWMGVPVLTIAGNTFASRRAVSHLSAVGLSDLVAQDDDALITNAVLLAGDHAGLDNIRSSLRRRIERSQLGDVRGFTRQLEDGYSYMCEQIYLNIERQ